ncbi:MAG TPA: hypothetical protein VH186_17440 [Chloroflexia bacterium]|nr:hypothetical protein [Chloroflexia bacterium]
MSLAKVLLGFMGVAVITTLSVVYYYTVVYNPVPAKSPAEYAREQEQIYFSLPSELHAQMSNQEGKWTIKVTYPSNEEHLINDYTYQFNQSDECKPVTPTPDAFGQTPNDLALYDEWGWYDVRIYLYDDSGHIKYTGSMNTPCGSRADGVDISFIPEGVPASKN